MGSTLDTDGLTFRPNGEPLLSRSYELTFVADWGGKLERILVDFLI